MKKMKRFFALFLAMAMVLGMSMTVLADGETPTPKKPTETDAEKVTIENVESGATYKAYQIIDAKYNGNGFTGYVWAAGMEKAGQTVTDAEAEINSTMITALAKDPSALTIKKESFNPATDSLEVGTWMVLVTPPTGDATKVYNPMIVSVYYSLDLTGQLNYPVAGSVDANKAWTLATTDAYMKSSTVTVEKTVDTTSNGMGEVGDEVTFTLKGTIPSYSSEYTSAVYTLTDTITNGLQYTGNVSVTLGGQDATGKYTTTFDGSEGNTKTTFEVAFESSEILKLANATLKDREVIVTYKAKITEAAVTAVGENIVSLNYTNAPGSTTDATPATAYTYTFSLDGVLGKVDGDGNALDGATFTLYRSKDDKGNLSNPVGSVTTTATGEGDAKVVDNNIKFTGLDGKDTYYLQETAAPEGYSLNTTIYTITFTDIVLNGEEGTSYKVNVTGDDGTSANATISYGEKLNDFATTIVNTTLSALPSTGGIGTTIFTVGGCAIMIMAAGMFFASRKRASR